MRRDVNQRRPGVVGIGSRPNLPRDDKIVYHAPHALARQPEVAYGTRDGPQAVRSAASPEIRRTTGRPSLVLSRVNQHSQHHSAQPAFSDRARASLAQPASGGPVVTARVDEAAVRDLYARLLDAWNCRSAQDFAALFAEDGSMIGYDGSQAVGPEVLDHLTSIFADHPTAAYVAKVRTLRPLGRGAVVLRAGVGMVPPGQRTLNTAVNAVQTLVAEEHAGSWRIVLFQNTPALYHGRPQLAERRTAELQELLPDNDHTD